MEDRELVTGQRANKLMESAKNKIGTPLRKILRRCGVSKNIVTRGLKRRTVEYRIIMNNAKYFTLSNFEITEINGFYTDNVEQYLSKVKYKQNAKFDALL